MSPELEPRTLHVTTEVKELEMHESVFYDVGYDIHIGLIGLSDKELLNQAEIREEIEWQENDFGSLEEYKKYNKQSRVYAAFRDETCVGLTRIFAGNPEIPPFAELPFDSKEKRQEVLDLCRNGQIEEVGTAAVNHELSQAPRHFVALHLWRLAYRDAIEKGMQYWGIIMEPDRVQTMNERFHFTFEKLGSAVDYQGGDCAAFIMDLKEVDKKMSKHMPELYHWFVKEPLEKVEQAS